MQSDISLQILSNAISILICIGIVIKYLRYKKRLDVLQGLEDLKIKGELTLDDKNYLKANLSEYNEKAFKAEGLIKVLNPVFILITGVIFAFTPFSEAIIYMNVVVVSYLFIILDNLTFAPKTK